MTFIGRRLRPHFPQIERRSPKEISVVVFVAATLLTSSTLFATAAPTVTSPKIGKAFINSYVGFHTLDADSCAQQELGNTDREGMVSALIVPLDPKGGHLILAPNESFEFKITPAGNPLNPIQSAIILGKLGDCSTQILTPKDLGWFNVGKFLAPRIVGATSESFPTNGGNVSLRIVALDGAGKKIVVSSLNVPLLKATTGYTLSKQRCALYKASLWAMTFGKFSLTGIAGVTENIPGVAIVAVAANGALFAVSIEETALESGAVATLKFIAVEKIREKIDETLAKKVPILKPVQVTQDVLDKINESVLQFKNYQLACGQSIGRYQAVVAVKKDFSKTPNTKQSSKAKPKSSPNPKSSSDSKAKPTSKPSSHTSQPSTVTGKLIAHEVGRDSGKKSPAKGDIDIKLIFHPSDGISIPSSNETKLRLIDKKTKLNLGRICTIPAAISWSALIDGFLYAIQAGKGPIKMNPTTCEFLWTNDNSGDNFNASGDLIAGPDTWIETSKIMALNYQGRLFWPESVLIIDKGDGKILYHDIIGGCAGGFFALLTKCEVMGNLGDYLLLGDVLKNSWGPSDIDDRPNVIHAVLDTTNIALGALYIVGVKQPYFLDRSKNTLFGLDPRNSNIVRIDEYLNLTNLFQLDPKANFIYANCGIWYVTFDGVTAEIDQVSLRKLTATESKKLKSNCTSP